MRKMKNKRLEKLTLSAVFLCIGMVLPLLTMQVKEIGDSLLPMHIPVMLCGLLCGWQYGLAVGFILPFLRSAIFSMPPMYPNAIWMAAEMATYGFVIGFLYWRSNKKSIARVYFSLIAAMLAGRMVWGVVKSILLGLGTDTFTFKAFLIGGFVDSILGIILQLTIIPLVMNIINSLETRKQRDIK